VTALQGGLVFQPSTTVWRN